MPRLSACALLTAIVGLTVALAVSPVAASATDRVSTGSRGLIVPYMGMRGLSPDPNFAKDRNGVVLAVYPSPLGEQYNPVTISQAAIMYYNGLHYGHVSASDRATYREALFIQAEWLVRNQEANGLWLYRFPFAGQPLPWQSAMAQGQAISALIRANAERPSSRYRIAIDRARSTFERVWSRGGVATWQRVGSRSYLVYEEYMAPYSPHTLNGWMYSMAGLYEDWFYLKDPKAKSDLMNADRGIAALRKLLPYYDTGNWSTYNLKTLNQKVNGTLARVGYHEIHIRQLRWYAQITNDGVFEVYADRFQRYLDACTAAGRCPP